MNIIAMIIKTPPPTQHAMIMVNVLFFSGTLSTGGLFSSGIVLLVMFVGGTMIGVP